MSNPGAQRPRTKPAGERREELLDAAEDLFAAKGYAATRIDDIVKGAGVAKGTFYLYFTSKDDVVSGLRARFVQSAAHRIAEAVAAEPEGDWPGRLDAWCRAAAAVYLDSAPSHRLVFVEIAPESQEGLIRNPLVEQLAELLSAGAIGTGTEASAAGAAASGAVTGGWLCPDPAFTAAFLFNGLHGMVTGASPQSDRHGLIASLQAQLRRSLGLAVN